MAKWYTVEITYSYTEEEVETEEVRAETEEEAIAKAVADFHPAYGYNPDAEILSTEITYVEDDDEEDE